MAGADVAEQLAAEEWVGDEGDAAAAASAVGAAEDVGGEGSLEDVGPGGAIGGLGAVRGRVGRRRRRDDAIAKRGGGGEGTVVRPGVLAGVGDEGGEALEEGKNAVRYGARINFSLSAAPPGYGLGSAPRKGSAVLDSYFAYLAKGEKMILAPYFTRGPSP